MTLLARRKPYSIALILALAISLGAVFLSPGRATAGGVEQQNCGSRPGGPIVLYWGTWQSGAYICVIGTISDMAGNGSGGCCDSYGTPALYFWRLPAPHQSGGGQRVWNNAASAANLDTAYYARIWYNQGMSGPYFDVGPCCGASSTPINLGSVTNNNRALTWYRA